jgi:hypothetical protein
VLTEFLCNYSILPAGPRTELGAGLGLVGITLAQLDREHGIVEEVVCTDGKDECLSYLQANAIANSVGQVRGEILEWGNIEQLRALRESLGQTMPGLVVGADVLYDIKAIPSLGDTVRSLSCRLPKHFWH